jgi:hypothetical protein
MVHHRGGRTRSGTRGIVQQVDLNQADDAIYLFAFLRSEQVTGESAWLREIDLLPA